MEQRPANLPFERPPAPGDEPAEPRGPSDPPATPAEPVEPTPSPTVVTKPPPIGMSSTSLTVVFDLTLWQRHDVENKLRGAFGLLNGYSLTG